jgi:uncharacterized protein
MRFLYDTNVLATLTRREELARFRRLVDSADGIHITSDYVLAELETVLRTKFEFTRQKAKVTTNALAKLSEVVAPKAVERVSRDPLDDYILAAALEGRADYLVTADIDLLILGSYKTAQILSPDQFRQRMSGIK